MVRYVEHLPDAPDDDRKLNDMSFAFYDSMLVFDHITKTITVLALAWIDQHDSPETAYDMASQRVDDLIRKLKRPEKDLVCSDVQLPQGPPPVYESNFTQAEFEDAVKSVSITSGW